MRDVKFPIYPIPSDNWDIIDGLVIVDGAVVDDLNRPGDSIGIRRIQSGRSKKELLRLKNPHFYYADIIKSKKRHFISSDGEPFTYEKTGYQRIRCHQIKGFDRRGTFTFVWFRGITIPFEISRPPKDSDALLWARVLYYGDYPWMVFDFQKEKVRDTRIKV